MLPIIPLIAMAIKSMVIEKVTEEMEENIDEAVNEMVDDVAKHLNVGVEEVKIVADKVKKLRDLQDMLDEVNI